MVGLVVEKKSILSMKSEKMPNLNFCPGGLAVKASESGFREAGCAGSSPGQRGDLLRPSAKARLKFG